MQATPFDIDVPQAHLDDLGRRLALTRFAPDVDNDDGRYGLPTAVLRPLVERWRDGYDWRAQEAELNRWPHARVEIDGVRVHFLHVRGNGPAPLPLVFTHGFPWTFLDLHRIIGPLTDPAAHGGDPADAFDLVVPSLPGYALSTPLRRSGIGFVETADLWARLLRDVLGYDRFGAAGGDWGALVTAQLAHRYGDRMHGIHLTSAVALPSGWATDRPWDLLHGAVDRATPERRADTIAWERRHIGHIPPQVVQPQALAHALHDSPAGLLAWLTQPRVHWYDPAQDFDDVFPPDFLLTTAMLYWLNDAYVSAARFYAESASRPWTPWHDRRPAISAPTGLSLFTRDAPPGIEADALAASYDLVHLHKHDVGGHFGPMERPDEVVADIRTTFRQLR